MKDSELHSLISTASVVTLMLEELLNEGSLVKQLESWNLLQDIETCLTGKQLDEDVDEDVDEDALTWSLYKERC